MENQIDAQNSAVDEATQPPVAQETNLNEPLKKQKTNVRRVGTLTMGIALIITGFAICAVLFVPTLDVILLAKLTPLLLVALGIEIIIACAKNDSSKIKYDFLSVFICFTLFFGAICISMVPVIFEYFGPTREAVSANIDREMQDKLQISHGNYKDLYRISINTSFNQLRKFNVNEGLSAVTPSDTIYIYAEFYGNYESKEAFAKAVLPLYAELNSMSTATVSFNAKNTPTENQNVYDIDMRGIFPDFVDEAKLASLVNEQIFRQETNMYMNDHAYYNYLNNEQEREAQNTQYEQETANSTSVLPENEVDVPIPSSSTPIS